MLPRLLVLALLASILVLAPAAASPDPPQTCVHGAISAIGPVDAQGNGDATPDVRCFEP